MQSIDVLLFQVHRFSIEAEDLRSPLLLKRSCETGGLIDLVLSDVMDREG